MILGFVLASLLQGDVPSEVQAFIEKGTTALAIERADLNRDTREDVILVLEPNDPDQPRPLVLLWTAKQPTSKNAWNVASRKRRP